MSSVINTSNTKSPVIDAYCHVGIPRFGTAEDALAIADQSGISKSVFVLGPGVPDYETLFRAIQIYGNRVRGIGIPFGETKDQVDETVLLQLRAGVLGLRVEPRTLLKYPSILQHLGQHRRWLYAIGAVDSDDIMRKLIDWLDQYPHAHIAAPHFLRTHDSYTQGVDHLLLLALVSHPRFHPIFSRHGGMGSSEPYPHKDYAVWVDEVIAASGWDNVLWGSEYPVYTWRDEIMETCKQWLPSLLENITGDNLSSFLSRNTQRLIFDRPAPEQETVDIPAWIDLQFNRERTVPLFPDGFHVPMHVYQSLHHRYVNTLKQNPHLQLSAFISELVKA